jgi:hypothetical protein
LIGFLILAVYIIYRTTVLSEYNRWGVLSTLGVVLSPKQC